ncbi:glycosyltransferase [Patescibacteria group bacterium]|nr:glycosyltransferase [Patescibacteria group bacterium]
MIEIQTLKKKIAGVVIIYNPPKSLICNINSYINFVDTLIIIDNSQHRNKAIINELNQNRKIIYNFSNKNIGIAKALNKAANIAIQKKYNWLLTMDQDSKFNPGALNLMLEFIQKNNTETVGIVAPIQKNKLEKYPTHTAEYEEILSSMNSGNLINLNIYKKTGPYLEKLFIDYVDHEYCLKIKSYGYKIIRINNAILYHNLGNLKKHASFLVTNHNEQRRFFITLNRLYVMNKYKKQFPIFYNICLRASIREFVFIILFENRKYLKIKNIIKAIIHYNKNFKLDAK